MNNQNMTGNQWMARCNPERNITELVIPGTHDSMTSTCNERYYHTQTLDLNEQLNSGVRFLDIRLRKEMVAAHREWISDIRAAHIFEKCGQFLQQNSSEFILMRIQNANERKDDFIEYGEALREEITKYRDILYQWHPSEIDEQGNPHWPTIMQAAGKIIPIECAPPAMQLNKVNGLLWAANWHQNPRILLQDLWDGPSLTDKCQAISQLIEDSKLANPEILALNHISATNGELGFPNAYADYLNNYTDQLWKTSRKNSFRGVQIYDFIDSSICKNLFELNF